MKRPFSLGDLVRFKTTTGQYAEGIVIHRIVEKRQPTIFLIECEDRRRAFRFETELTPDRGGRNRRRELAPVRDRPGVSRLRRLGRRRLNRRRDTAALTFLDDRRVPLGPARLPSHAPRGAL